MRKFRELAEFAQRFESMDVAKSQHWKAYWPLYAQRFTRNARKLAMHRVRPLQKPRAAGCSVRPVAGNEGFSEGELEAQPRHYTFCRGLRVYTIEKAIPQKDTAKPDIPAITLPRRNPPRNNLSSSPTQKAKACAGRIRYIEREAVDLTGAARIGRMSFSKIGRTLCHRGQRFQSLKGKGFKSIYDDVDSGDDYWISGPKQNGEDRLYGEGSPVEIDDAFREQYWRDITRQPERIHKRLV